MNFVDLYRFANGQTADSVPVDSLRGHVVALHPTVGDVEFWGCALNSDVSRGHMVLSLDRSSAYDEAYIVASIRFDVSMDIAWRRYVCCKELMHVFDDSLQRVDGREKFFQLMEELENNPIVVNQSEMFRSERDAEWQALLALCPPRLRQMYKPKFDSGELDANTVAAKLVVPPVLIRAIMGPQYARTLERLTGDTIGDAPPGSPVPFAPRKRPTSR